MMLFCFIFCYFFIYIILELVFKCEKWLGEFRIVFGKYLLYYYFFFDCELVYYNEFLISLF